MQKFVEMWYTTVKWGDLDLFLVYFMISYPTAATQPLDTQNL